MKEERKGEERKAKIRGMKDGEEEKEERNKERWKQEKE